MNEILNNKTAKALKPDSDFEHLDISAV
jgi:hypothetical protein